MRLAAHASLSDSTTPSLGTRTGLFLTPSHTVTQSLFLHHPLYSHNLSALTYNIKPSHEQGTIPQEHFVRYYLNARRRDCSRSSS
eukprot:scaffold2844_cov31-Tisochrysis_lutea.AAC.6